MCGLPYGINLFYTKFEGCYSYGDLVGHGIFFGLCSIMLIITLRINTVIEQKQVSELGQLDIVNYRPSAFLSLELETFWDRFSWFQLLIASLIISCLCDCFIIFVGITYKKTYEEVGSCQLIYPLVYNPSKPEDIEQKYHFFAFTVTILNYLLTDFLPYFFLLRIIEVSLIKKRYA